MQIDNHSQQHNKQECFQNDDHSLKRDVAQAIIKLMFLHIFLFIRQFQKSKLAQLEIHPFAKGSPKCFRTS